MNNSIIPTKFLITCTLLFSSPLLITDTYANTFGDIEVGLVHDDNLTRTDYSADKKAGNAAEIFVDYGKFYDHEDNWSTSILAFSQITKHFDYDQLSSFGVGISGSARKKLGLGAYSSNLSASVSLAANSVNDSSRSNTALDISFDWSKRINDVWELMAGLSFDSTNAKDNVYDTKGSTIFVSADYTINEKLLFNLGISQRQGDIVSITNASTNPSESTYGYLTKGSGSNWHSDTVFGSGLTAYRLDATTLIFKTSLSYALYDNSSVNAGYEHQDSSLDYGINYKNNIFRINYIYSF